MLGENLKRLRKEKGYSQDELAERLHVVRQTVSKWEKELSVPDAQMLINLSEILDTPVNVLLGEDIREEEQDQTAVISEQLSRINARLSERALRMRHVWMVVRTILILLVALIALTMILSAAR